MTGTVITDQELYAYLDSIDPGRHDPKPRDCMICSAQLYPEDEVLCQSCDEDYDDDDED